MSNAHSLDMSNIEAGSVMNIDQAKESSNQMELEAAYSGSDIENDAQEAATKRQNELPLSDERTNIEETTKIYQAKEFIDLDKFKKVEDNANKWLDESKTELGLSSGNRNSERDLKKADSLEEGSGDGDYLSDLEEWDPEWQELSSGSEEGHEGCEEDQNKEKFMLLIDSAVKVDIDKPESLSNIKEFSANIYELIRERKADFKKDQYGAKKISLMKWLKGSIKSDEHLELIQAVKAQVVGLATKVSSLLATLMFLMSRNDEMKAKLPVLGFSINWVTEDGVPVVASTIVYLVRMIVQEVKRKLEKGKSIVPDRPLIDITVFTEFYQAILLFLDGIKFLDNILMLQKGPDSDESVKDSLFSLEAELKDFEKEYLEKVESGIRGICELKELYSDDPEDVTIHEAVELKINELWNQVWKLEEDKTCELS